MRHFLTFLLSIYFFASYGQAFSYPSIKTTGRQVSDFIPAGWTILDSAFGDLNKDGIKDAAIVIQHRDSIFLVDSWEDTVVTQPRMLLLLFKNTIKNEFSLIEQSNSFILKHEHSIMDDPYQGVTIEKGILKIEFRLFYNMGSWHSTSSSYKFRFDGRTFVLIGADIFTIHRATLDFEDYSYNFLTKKRSYTKGNGQNGSKKTTRKTIILNSLKTFKTFEEPYSWEIEGDIYL